MSPSLFLAGNDADTRRQKEVTMPPRAPEHRNGPKHPQPPRPRRRRRVWNKQKRRWDWTWN